MSFASGLLKGLKIAAPYVAGAGAGAGTFFASGGNVPLAIGVGGTVAGQLGTAFDTRVRMQGATDEEIASAETAARRSEGRRIEGESARASRMATAQAGTGGTLGSGLAARGLSDVNAARGGAYADLNARLEAIRINAVQNRTYVPELGMSGIIARGIGTAATPFLAAGVGQALAPAAAGGAGASPSALLGGGAPMGFESTAGNPMYSAATNPGVNPWEKLGNAGYKWAPTRAPMQRPPLWVPGG